MQIREVVLIGFGAIGSAVFERMCTHPGLRITHVVVSQGQCEAVQQRLGDRAQAVSAVPTAATLVLECAGHGALEQHVLPASPKWWMSLCSQLKKRGHRLLRPQANCCKALNTNWFVHLIAFADDQWMC